MAANSEFVTPDTIDTLRYLRIECNEAADVELRNRLSKHPRNNGRDNTVYEELADALMLALTALPEIIHRELCPFVPVHTMDAICNWSNFMVVGCLDGDLDIFANPSWIGNGYMLLTTICCYPGMNTEAELRKCWHRLAWKHASKAMDSYPEELK